VADLVRRPAAGRPSRRQRQHDRGPRVEYLAFLLAGEPYAAPVSLIREILKPPPLTPVPRAPHSVLGIISVRGQLVTVIDLRRRLRLAETPMGSRTRILLAEGPGNETLGLFVDEVLQVHRLSEAEIELAAPALGGEVADYITGIARPVRVGAAEEQRAASISAPSAEAAEVVILLDLRAVMGPH
jgi:purine-binding chemotaxis protein CheW